MKKMLPLLLLGFFCKAQAIDPRSPSFRSLDTPSLSSAEGSSQASDLGALEEPFYDRQVVEDAILPPFGRRAPSVLSSEASAQEILDGAEEQEEQEAPQPAPQPEAFSGEEKLGPHVSRSKHGAREESPEERDLAPLPVYGPHTIIRGYRAPPRRGGTIQKIREQRAREGAKPKKMLSKAVRLEAGEGFSLEGAPSDLKRTIWKGRRLKAHDKILFLANNDVAAALPRGTHARYRVILFPLLRRNKPASIGKACKAFKTLDKVSGEKQNVTCWEANAEFIQAVITQIFKNSNSCIRKLEVNIDRLSTSGMRPQDFLPATRGGTRDLKTLEEVSIFGPFTQKTLEIVGKHAENLTRLNLSCEKMTDDAVNLLSFKNLKSLGLGCKDKPLSGPEFDLPKWLRAFEPQAQEGLENPASQTAFPLAYLPLLEKLSVCSVFSQTLLLKDIQASSLGSRLKFLRVSGPEGYPYEMPSLSARPSPYHFPLLEELCLSKIDFRGLEGGLKTFFSPKGFNAPRMKILRLLRCEGIKASEVFHLFQGIPSLVELEIKGGLIDEAFLEEDTHLVRLPEERRVRLSLLNQGALGGASLAEILFSTHLCDHLAYLSLKGTSVWGGSEKVLQKRFPFLTELHLGEGFSTIESLIQHRTDFPDLKVLSIESRWEEKAPCWKKTHKAQLEEAFQGVEIKV